jgi:hypothetical protein
MMQYFAFYCESCVFLDKSLVVRIYGKIGAESDPMERSSVNLQDNAPQFFFCENSTDLLIIINSNRVQNFRSYLYL